MGAVARKSSGIGYSLGLLVFVSLCLILAVSSLQGTPAYRPWISPSPCYCHTGSPGSHDPPNTLPPSAYQNEFRTIPEYEDMTEAGDALWSAMTSTTQGSFLWVKYNETYKTGYGVSMFHALHCLSMIRDTIRGNAMEMKRRPIPQASEDEVHTAHCFSYIAQSLLCSADGTLERPKTIYDNAGNVLRDDVNGDHVVHKCKDAAFLREKIEGTEKRPLSSMPELHPGATMWDLYDQSG